MKALKAIGSFVASHKMLIVVLFCIALVFQIVRLTQRNTFLSERMVRQDHTYKVWADSMGREHAETRTQLLHVAQLQAEDKAKVEEAARIEKVRPERINSITQVKSVSKGHLEAILDTPGNFASVDSFLTLKGQIKGSKLVVDYTYTDVGNVVFYNKPRKFLGITIKNTPYLDVYFNNPNTHIEGLTNIMVKHDNRILKMGIGPSVGVMYNGAAFKPYIGLSLNYNVIRF